MKRNGLKVITNVREELYPPIFKQDVASFSEEELERIANLYNTEKKLKTLPQKRANASDANGGFFQDIPFVEFLGLVTWAFVHSIRHWAWIDNRLEKNQHILKMF